MDNISPCKKLLVFVKNIELINEKKIKENNAIKFD